MLVFSLLYSLFSYIGQIIDSLFCVFLAVLLFAVLTQDGGGSRNRGT